MWDVAFFRCWPFQSAAGMLSVASRIHRLGVLDGWDWMNDACWMTCVFLGVLEMIAVKCSGHFSLDFVMWSCVRWLWFSFSCILHLDCLHFAIWDALFRCCSIFGALFGQTLLPSISCWILQCGQVVLYQNDEADIMFLVSACLRSIISFTDTDVNNPGWWARRTFRTTGNTCYIMFPFFCTLMP